MLTVKSLIEKLQKLPQDLKVIVASDQEGNGFRDLGCAQEENYDGQDIISEEDLETYVDEDFNDIEKVVCLW